VLLNLLALTILLVYIYIRRTAPAEAFEILLKLNFSDGCGCPSIQINVPVNFKVRSLMKYVRAVYWKFIPLLLCK